VKWKLSDKALATIKAVAPGLATALGGPLAGAAAGALVSALGGDEKAAEAALLTQDPATLLALRKAEQDFAVRMRELDIEPERLAVQDRASARDMAKTGMKPQMLIASAFVIGYFFTMGALLFGLVEVDGIGAQILPVLVGALTAGLQQILNFFFGSTLGSKEKTELLYRSKPADSP